MKTEREYLEDAQAGIADAKTKLKQVIASIGGMAEHNKDDAAKSNAVYLSRAWFKNALAALEMAHGEATEHLLKHWPEHADLAKGPGR